VTVSVRDAMASDPDALLVLLVQLSPANADTDRSVAERLLAALIGDERTRLMVATDGHLLLGTATLVVVPNLTHNGRPWVQLENMVVDESRCGHGIGKALLDACKEAAWEAGSYKVQLQSANARDGAHSFYAREGFEPSSQGFRFYR